MRKVIYSNLEMMNVQIALAISHPAKRFVKFWKMISINDVILT